MSVFFAGGNSEQLIWPSFVITDVQDFCVCGWARRTSDTNNYATLFYLEDGGLYAYFGTSSNGTTLVVDTGNMQTFATSPATNEWFFWAVRGEIDAFTGYWSSVDDTNWSDTENTNQVNSSLNDDILLSDAGFEWEGEIANVKLFDTDIGEAALLAEKYRYIPNRFADLIGWYPFLEIGGSEFRDYSGNGYDLTEGAQNPPQQSSNSPPIAWGDDGIFIPFDSGSTTHAGASVLVLNNTLNLLGSILHNGQISANLIHTLSSYGAISFQGQQGLNLTLNFASYLVGVLEGTITKNITATLSSNAVVELTGQLVANLQHTLTSQGNLDIAGVINGNLIHTLSTNAVLSLSGKLDANLIQTLIINGVVSEYIASQIQGGNSIFYSFIKGDRY